jgi:hypothetical protein
MIAGHHDHADAGLPAIGDSLFHPNPRRVPKADKAEKAQTLIIWYCHQGDRFLGEGEDSQTILSQRRGTL